MDNRNWRALWIYGATLISILLVATTIQSIGILSLRQESNLAVVWSGMLLFLSAVHAFDGRQLTRDDARLSRAWLVISLILVTLSFDEIGSLHERLPQETQTVYWTAVLPFALTYAAFAAHSLLALFSDPRTRAAAVRIGLGFGLFGLAAVQEMIEWSVTWPEEWKPIRGAIEEGSELAGMLLILRASMDNTQGLLAREGRRPSPVVEAVHAWRRPIVALSLLGIPYVIWASANLEPDPWGHGIPAEWPPAALFFMAALAALRPFAMGSGEMQWSGWALFTLSMLGCASSILDPSTHLPLWAMTAICVAGGIVCFAARDLELRTLAPPALVAALTVGLAWLAPPSLVVGYGVLSVTGLAFYLIASSARRSGGSAGRS